MRFLDTNITVRYLTGDDPVKAAACLRLLERVERGEEQVRTCEAIITEIVYVLSARAHYDLTHEEIRRRLTPVLMLRGLKLPGKHLYLRALDIYADSPSLDFEDALTLAYMENEGITDLYSYDRNFDDRPGVTRIEP